MKLDKKLLAGGAGAIEMKSQTKHAIRKDKVVRKELVSKTATRLEGFDLDESSDKSIGEQLRDVLEANSVRRPPKCGGARRRCARS